MSTARRAESDSKRPSADTRPNILLIVVDQMRGDCLSLEGHLSLLTPNLDEIGGTGAHFSRAYTTCASSIAARRSLLTGQYPSTNGVVGFHGGCAIRSATLPGLLHGTGYDTALVGRNMHQYPDDEAYGYETRILGSTYLEDDDYARTLEAHAPGSGGVKGHGVSFNGWTAKPWHLAEHLHPTNWTVDRSRGLLRERDETRPLFLTTSFYAPHPPLIPPAFYLDRYLRVDLPPVSIGTWASCPDHEGIGVGIDSARTVLRGEALRCAQAGYFGLINHIDDQLYWLISDFKVKSHQASRPWVVVFTSDHGEMLGDHYYFRKCEPYEGSARVPLLIQGSSDLGFQSHLACSGPVCLEDIMPTLLEAAGAELPAPIDGESLLPVLRGERGPLRSWLHAEHARCYSAEQAYHSLTDGRAKYIWRPHAGAEQLFDLREDPQELTDLATHSDHRKQLEQWRARLIERLTGRPEGFTDGERLIPGRLYLGVLPHATGLNA